MSRIAYTLLILFLALLPGCGFSLSGVEVKPVHSSVQKPSNVAIYVAIKDGKAPLTDLDESRIEGSCGHDDRWSKGEHRL